MSTDAAPGPIFTDADLTYVRSALQASRTAHQANRLAEQEASDPRLRDSARRSQVAHDHDIVRIVSLLTTWHRSEVARDDALEPAVDPAEALRPMTPVALPGRDGDQRLVAALSAHAEAATVLGRAQMIQGLDPAARDLAEDHIRAAARHLYELRRVLQTDRGATGPGMA